jgi:hypothetical protein
MNARQRSTFALWTIAFLFFAGCDDSKNPLSDPQNSKPDTRLVGLWRFRSNEGDVTHYHIGPLGHGLPECLMRVVAVTRSKEGELQPPGQLVVFPTALGSSTYLNVAEAKEQQIKLLEDKGWNPDVLGGFLIPKYKVEGDALLVWPVDRDAKKAAIEAGKVKGVVQKQDSGNTVRFIDTPESVARFVADTGDSLFAREPLRLERVK